MKLKVKTSLFFIIVLLYSFANQAQEYKNTFDSVFSLSLEKVIEYRKTLQYDEALELLSELEKKIPPSSYNKYKSKILIHLERLYGKRAEHAKAIKASKELLQFNITDGTVIWKNYYNLGDSYNFIGDKSKALEYYLKSMEISEHNNDFSRLKHSLISIGNIYHILGEHQTALAYALQAHELAKNI